MSRSTVQRRVAASLALAGVMLGSSAHATLILDTSVTSSFGTASTSTTFNDFPGLPSEVYFGQLRATTAGSVDFFYLGNEAGYTNTLLYGTSGSHSTAGLADVFSVPGSQLSSSVAVGAGALLDFGFCTSGGASVSGAGYCAHNDVTESLLAQFNYGGVSGYRSIAYLPLTGLTPFSYAAAPVAGQQTASDYWMILWDDSGAANDDNHDDYIAVARFTPTSVPEPGTLSLLAAGLLAAGLSRRRRAAAAV